MENGISAIETDPELFDFIIRFQYIVLDVNLV